MKGQPNFGIRNGRHFAGGGKLGVWPALLALLLLPVFAGAGGTQDLNGEVLDKHDHPLAGAVCTLRGGVLPAEGITTTTSERGRFAFPGLAYATYTLTCAAVGYQAVSKSDIQITTATYAALQVVLSAETVLRQRVEVRAQGPTASEQGAAPPAQLNAVQLQTLPLVEQKFKAALPLAPGVVRTPDGRINIKGEVENQGLLLVDSAEMVDPVTGAFSIEIPLDAVESLSVYKNTDLADYGRFSGGLTTVETRAPSSRFEYDLSDFMPWLREHKLRFSVAVFNLTNHSNPRDVYNNVASPFYGHFVGFQHRFYDGYFDIVY